MMVDPKFTAHAKEMVSTGRWPAGEMEETEGEDGMTHEEYLRGEIGSGRIGSIAAEWAVSEITRLREFEAREAIVTNLMAAWVEVIDGKWTVDRFEQLLKSSEAGMCRAIECLGRRDKIRKLEGKLKVLRTLSERYHDEKPGTCGKWVSAADIEHSLSFYLEELENARAKK